MGRLIALTALACGLWAEDVGWLSHRNNDAGWRYSELKEIHAGNVARLTPKWMFQTKVPGNMETTPLVIGNLMYITASSNHAFALDLRTGAEIWHYSKTPPKPLGLCCGEVNRGFAAMGDRLFKVNIEDTLVALDKASGKLLWETMLGDWKKGYSGTVAPLIVKDKVLVGTGGAEFGTRGFVDAYSPSTGERMWRFYTAPDPGEPAATTWGKGKIVGGSTWITGTYDAELNLTYWGTGNPGPDMDGDVRPGDNLYSNSMIALDPDTGKMKWHFQFTPHDTHDWDSVADPVLVDLTIGGRKVKALIQANRNGHFYALDRTSGKFLFAKPYTEINWTTGIDATTGRPKVAAGLDPSEAGTRVCPGLPGGHNWQSTAYSPLTGLYYFTSTDGCQNFYKNPADFVEGAWYQLSGTEDVKGGSKGSVIALDPSNGEIRWRFPMSRNASGGLLATAGGLAFLGDYAGNLIAFDGRSGKVLWRFQTGAAITAAPVTYTFEGRQYVAVAAGGTLITFGL